MITRMLLLFAILLPIYTQQEAYADRLDRFMKREARRYERKQIRENRKILKEQLNDY